MVSGRGEGHRRSGVLSVLVKSARWFFFSADPETEQI